MKPGKRGLILSLALFLFGSVSLSACSQTDASEATITLSTWGSAQEITTLKQLLAHFEKQHPSTHIKLLHIPDNYFQKLHLLIAGDLAPDVMFVNSINYPVYASHGVFLDMNPHVRKTSFYPQSLSAFEWPKQSRHSILGAVPRDISNVLVYYNRSWFQKKRIQEPNSSWTWVDFIRTGQQLTEDKNHDGVPERFGVSFYTKPPLFWLPFVWSADGALLNTSLSTVALATPQALTGLQFVQDLRWKYHIAPRQIESGGINMSQLFLQEKIAMLVSGRWSVPVFREQATFDWDVVPLPVGPSGKSRVGIDASGYAVSKKSKHQKESIALVQFLTSANAVNEVAKSGLIVPARQDVATSEAFLNSAQKPRHSQYFLSIIPDGVPAQTPPRWNEFSEELMLMLQPAWDGQQSPKEALSPQSVKKLDSLLQVGAPE